MPTPDELAKLAAVGHALRRDWPYKSLLTHLTRHHADVPYRELGIALFYIATDPDTTTPARLREAGPWWPAAQRALNATRERDDARAIPGDPRTDTRPRCPIHGRHELAPPYCRACRSEELAGTRAKPVPVPDEPVEPDHRMRAAGDTR